MAKADYCLNSLKMIELYFQRPNKFYETFVALIQ